MLKPRSSASKSNMSPAGQRSAIAYVPINSISPDPRNPRKHRREQIWAIAHSIEAFGFNAPVLVDKGGCIIAGHGRFEAAKYLGMKDVPVVRLEHLTKHQAKAYMLADNKLTDRSSWDDELLAVHLNELSQIALEFEIEATGFELPEIDFRIQSVSELEEGDEADEFRVADGPAISRPGDLWHLGNHQLFCGSALEPTSYKALLGETRAAAIFMDPPYNVKIGGHVSGLGAVEHREFVMASGEMTEAEFTSFLAKIFELGRIHTDPGGLIYACMDWRHMGEMLAASSAGNLDLLNLCVWVKSNGGMGAFYRSKHELVFVLRNGAVQHRNNVQLGRFGRNRTNVWNYAGANSFPRKGQKSGLDLHPTVKPIALVADAILDSTVRNAVVLDPFLGSGTTILAAERTQRRGCGIEIDTLYVDTAIRRWEGMTGHRAIHSCGRSFAEISNEREAGQ